MIMVDTNIIIDYLHGDGIFLDTIMESDEIATCGIVYAELLHGIKSKEERRQITDAVNEFHWIKTNEDIWEKVGDNLNILRKNGVNIPFQDGVLATLCIQSEIPIASQDKHFLQIKKFLPALELYEEKHYAGKDKFPLK